MFGFVVGFVEFCAEELQTRGISKAEDQHKECKGTCSQTPPTVSAPHYAAAMMLRRLFR